MNMDPKECYRKVLQCCEHAETTGARILGLGAFTSVVGDAGITIAKEADIAITSGNSYTVASTLEAAKLVCRQMGHDPREFSSMVIGATGSIGAVCSRLLAYVSKRVHLVAPRPEKLLELQKRIQEENPHCEVTISQTSSEYIEDPDLIITTTTSRGAKLIDIMRVKPGAVICDVARPLDMKEEDGLLRPDVLIIESGELEVPGPVDFGTDIGLPPKTAYACLSETMILAMEGKFEDYTLGRNLEIDKVKEIYKLGKKHGFKLAAIRSFGRVIRESEIPLIRERANEARRRLALAEGVEPVLLVAWEDRQAAERLDPRGRSAETVATEQRP
jgi:predicted amino acid dehydrogenase